jgi:hypothetical protein
MLNVQWLLADAMETKYLLRANADDHTYEDTNKKTSRPSRDYLGRSKIIAGFFSIAPFAREKTFLLLASRLWWLIRIQVESATESYSG